MSPSEIASEFHAIVRRKGMHEGLRFLNARTPHRYTGIYRFDGDMLRSVYLFDQFDPSQPLGADVKMSDAYCSIVGQRRASLAFDEIGADPLIPVKPDSAVVSYCGALIMDDADEPFGSLCHFDTKPCDTLESEIPVLEAIAPLIFRALQLTPALADRKATSQERHDRAPAAQGAGASPPPAS